MRRIAVIIGAGPGLGVGLAQSLASTHSLLLLSRSLPGSLPQLKLKIPDDHLIAASSDGSRSSLDTAIKQAQDKWPDGVFDVGIFNVGGKFAPGGFLGGSEETLKENLDSGMFVRSSPILTLTDCAVMMISIGAFNFCQSLIPHLLSHHSDTGDKRYYHLVRPPSFVSVAREGVWTGGHPYRSRRD